MGGHWVLIGPGHGECPWVVGQWGWCTRVQVACCNHASVPCGVCAVVRRVLPLEAGLLCVSAGWWWAVFVVETCSVSVVPPLPVQPSTDTVVGGIFEGTSFATDGYASDDARLCV